MRDALSMLDQALAGGERPLTAANVRQAIGLADPATLHTLLEALAGSDGAAALRAVAAAFDAGADPRQLVRETSRLARAAEFAALGHAQGADVGEEDGQLAATLARVAPQGFWLRALEILQATELELRQPVDARLQVEYCVMRLVRDSMAPAAQVADLEARVARLEGGAAARSAGPAMATPTGVGGPATGPSPVLSRPAPAPAGNGHPVAPAPAGAQPAAPVAPPDALDAAPEPSPAAADLSFGTVESWRQHWGSLLEAVNRRDRALAGVLRDCRAIKADATSLTVGAPYNFQHEKLREPSRVAALIEAAGEVAGSPREVDAAFVGTDAPPVRPGGTGEATRAVLDAFAGSRVTSTRLRDGADRPQRDGSA